MSEVVATIENLRGWFRRGASDPHNTHMIVACDGWPSEDCCSPRYVHDYEDVQQVAAELRAEGLRIEEVYSYAVAAEEQLRPGERVWNW